MKKSSKSDLCLKKCAALCCTGISIPTNLPKTKSDIEELRFYIVHKNIEIYIRNRRWYILVNEKCRNLNRKNLCKEYETRPLICRNFDNDGCEYWGDYYDIRFSNEKELLTYLEERKKKR